MRLQLIKSNLNKMRRMNNGEDRYIKRRKRNPSNPSHYPKATFF